MHSSIESMVNSTWASSVMIQNEHDIDKQFVHEKVYTDQLPTPTYLPSRLYYIDDGSLRIKNHA